MSGSPYIVGIGGTMTPGSSTEQALALALDAAAAEGARTRLFGSETLMALPHYSYGAMEKSESARALVNAVREADGLIFASPGYHGTISGLVKTAIDFIEETSRDQRAYLDGLPVGLIVTAFGWQATGSTLATMRSIVHALRGWPTPLGVGIRTAPGMFEKGVCNDEGVANQLRLVGHQVAQFACLRVQDPSITATLN